MSQFAHSSDQNETSITAISADRRIVDGRSADLVEAGGRTFLIRIAGIAAIRPIGPEHAEYRSLVNGDAAIGANVAEVL
ncbi:hypothetical protein [Asanoa sp. NPDC050611]|uniref:hypothetical protein n=1 Tax=Asanoa sp. NPDC050611 TaxID=3157098 RepID=UPI0033DF70F3